MKEVLICLLVLKRVLSSPLNWAVYTRNIFDADNYEDSLPGLNEGDYIDDYDTYLEGDDDIVYEGLQEIDYKSLQGNEDLIDNGAEVFGKES